MTEIIPLLHADNFHTLQNGSDVTKMFIAKKYLTVPLCFSRKKNEVFSFCFVCTSQIHLDMKYMIIN